MADDAIDVYELYAGDTLPIISGFQPQADGVTPQNITGWDIQLHILYNEQNGGTLIKHASIPIGTDGLFSFPWTDGDLKEGLWLAKVVIISPSGRLTMQENEEGRRFKLRINP